MITLVSLHGVLSNALLEEKNFGRARQSAQIDSDLHQVCFACWGRLFLSAAGVEVTVLAQRLCKTRKCNDVVFPTSLPRCLSRKDMWVYFYSHGFGTQRRISAYVIMKTDV